MWCNYWPKYSWEKMKGITTILFLSKSSWGAWIMQKKMSDRFFQAILPSGLPDRYRHFVVQETLSLTDSSVELRLRLISNEKETAHNEKFGNLHVIMAAKRYSYISQSY